MAGVEESGTMSRKKLVTKLGFLVLLYELAQPNTGWQVMS